MQKSEALEVPKELRQEVPTVLNWARSLQVKTPDDYTAVVERLKEIKALSKRISEWFSPMKRKMDEAKKAILDAEKTLSVPLAQAEELAKSALLEYQREQDRIAEAERQRLQAIADQKAREEQARLEKQAAKLKTPEKKEALLEQAAAVQAPVIAVASKVPDVAGSSTRKTWDYEITDMDTFMQSACERRRYDMLLPNEKMLLAYAKAMREQAQFAGCRFYEKSTLAIGGR